MDQKVSNLQIDNKESESFNTKYIESLEKLEEIALALTLKKD